MFPLWSKTLFLPLVLYSQYDNLLYQTKYVDLFPNKTNQPATEKEENSSQAVTHHRQTQHVVFVWNSFF